jgi:hypothetical protein
MKIIQKIIKTILMFNFILLNSSFAYLENDTLFDQENENKSYNFYTKRLLNGESFTIDYNKNLVKKIEDKLSYYNYSLDKNINTELNKIDIKINTFNKIQFNQKNIINKNKQKLNFLRDNHRKNNNLVD